MFDIDTINYINREEEGMQKEQDQLDMSEDMQREQYEADKEEREVEYAESYSLTEY